MKMKSLAAFVAISMCLAAPAWGSDWQVDTGFWSTPGSWDPVGVPNGVAANITEPAALGLIGLALLAVRKRRS